MIKTAATVLAIAIGLFVLQPFIKSKSFEWTMSYSLWRIEMSDDLREEFKAVVHRTGAGFEAYMFDDVERETLRGLKAHLRAYEGREMSDDEAMKLLQQFEAVLHRHQL
jgi:hypothetical protein